MAGGGFGHAVLAGAVGGSSIAYGAVSGPLLATALDVAAAAATAGIAAHAVGRTARANGISSAGILHRAARRAMKRGDAPLAAHAADVMCRTLAGDRRALRSAAILLGRATSAHARGLALQLVGSWCSPLRELTELSALTCAPRAALENAAFVGEMVAAVGDVPAAPARAKSERLTVSGAASHYGLWGAKVEAHPDIFRLQQDSQNTQGTQTYTPTPKWEVAA
jgi:hypothetical protein